MSIPEQTFVDTHKDKVNEMKQLLMDYVKTLQQLKNRERNIVGNQLPDTESQRIQIKITEDGYPEIPTSIQY